MTVVNELIRRCQPHTPPPLVLDWPDRQEDNQSYTYPLIFSGGVGGHDNKQKKQVLKRKKMYEAQRDQLAAQSFNVDQARFVSFF